VAAGLQEDKLGRVVGLGSSVLFDKQDPLNAINRRISIIVMNKAAEEGLSYEGESIPDEDGSEASAGGAAAAGTEPVPPPAPMDPDEPPLATAAIDE
jgi:chemotaxis protein MotB